MKQKEQQVQGKSVFLTQSVGDYSPESFPSHSRFTNKTIGQRINQFVQDEVPSGGAGFITFMGSPGVGKSSSVPSIQEATYQALGLSNPKEHITYSQQDGKVLEVGGYVCENSNGIVTILHADHFFRAIGSDRREIMLQDVITCRKLWGNPRAALRFIRDLYAGRSTNIRIYTGTTDEKMQKEPKGIIDIKAHTQAGTTKIIIAEGVNVGDWSRIIKNRTTIKTLDILYNMSLEDSLIRVLRRDHDKKGYPFQEILQARLLEYYYIFELYLLPALRNPNTILFNKTRDIPGFTYDEKLYILEAIHIMRAKYLKSDSLLSSEQKKFIDTLSLRVIDAFSYIEPVTPEMLAQIRIRKLLKKNHGNTSSIMV